MLADEGRLGKWRYWAHPLSTRLRLRQLQHARSEEQVSVHGRSLISFKTKSHFGPHCATGSCNRIPVSRRRGGSHRVRMNASGWRLRRAVIRLRSVHEESALSSLFWQVQNRPGVHRMRLLHQAPISCSHCTRSLAAPKQTQRWQHGVLQNFHAALSITGLVTMHVGYRSNVMKEGSKRGFL